MGLRPATPALLLPGPDTLPGYFRPDSRNVWGTARKSADITDKERAMHLSLLPYCHIGRSHPEATVALKYICLQTVSFLFTA